jgi:hypothetical protein
MADETSKHTRRALLAAAAGGAAALAAQAAMPLAAAAANGDPVLLGTANDETATTSVANATADSDGFAVTASGPGIRSTSDTSTGVYGVAVSGAGAASNAETAYTGVYGWSPAHPGDGVGTGVWGDSNDWGVYGSGGIGVFGDGGIGVYGVGDYGVYGESVSNATPAVRADAASSTGLALQAVGKVRFSRSGRTAIGAGKSYVAVSLPGTSTSSKIFAVLATSRSGRYVRAVVPYTNKFAIYLNTTVPGTTYVSWFVLD